MAVVAQLMVAIGADTSGFSKGMSETQKQMTEAGNGIKKAGDGIAKAGGMLTAGITLPILGIGAAAIKASTDFNGAMANVATLIPGNIDRVNELKTTVQDMAIATGKSTDDLAGGLYQVISAFGNTADTAKILELNAKAAAAGLATTTDAINLTSAVTKGYGDTSAKAVQKVSDLAFQAVQLGQTTFPELAGSIGLVTPLASSLGVSMEEMFGVMATGSGVTGSTSEVATQLRGVFQSLMAPTKDMTVLLQDMGFKSGEAMVQQLGLQGTIDAMVGAAQKSGKPLQSYIGSIEGQTLALALSGAQHDTFTEKLAAMSKSTGATEQAFKDQTQGINANGFAMEQLKQKVIVTAQNLGDALAPALTKVLDAITPLITKISDVVTWFTNLDGDSQAMILTLVGVAAAIGPILVGIGSLVSLIGSLTIAAGALDMALLPFIGLIALIVVAIAGLVLAGVMLYRHWDEVKAKAMEIWGAIANFFTVTVPAAMEGLVGWFQALPGRIATFLGELPGKMAYIFGLIVGKSIRFGMDVVSGIINFFKTLPQNASNIFNNLLSSAVAKFNEIKARVISIAGSIISGLGSAIANAPQIFMNMGAKILSYVSGLPGKLWDKAKSIASNFWNGFKKGLGIGSPSLVERAFMAIGDQAFNTLGSLQKLAPKIKGEMFNITKPLPISMNGTVKNNTIPPVDTNVNNDNMGNEDLNGNGGVVINVYGLTVREEADIEKISQRLYNLQNSKLRSLGGAPSV